MKQLWRWRAYVAKLPNWTDKHVGNRIRTRRLMLNMSQNKLARTIGVTFQQVQKYEKGSNRVGASRLLQIASALEVPIGFFFEGLPPPNGASRKKDDEFFGSLCLRLSCQLERTIARQGVHANQVA